MGAIKEGQWYVHCPACGAFLIKSAMSDSEVVCRKCRKSIGVLVKDGKVTVYEKDTDNGSEMPGRINVYHTRLTQIQTQGK